MKQNKKILSDEQEFKKSTPPSAQDIERKLVSSLRLMSYLCFLLSLVSLIFAFFIHGEDRIAITLNINENSILTDIETIAGATLFTDMEPLEISAQDVLNFYVVSLIFASIGTSLFYLFSKKKMLSQFQSRKLWLGQ